MQMTTNRGSDAADALREPWKSSKGPDRPPPVPQGRATFHLPANLIDDLRNAVVALSGPPHRLTMSKLAENALRHELDRLRQEQAGADTGKPFQPRSGEVTRGRPIR
jgi:hypothetical protein